MMLRRLIVFNFRLRALTFPTLNGFSLPWDTGSGNSLFSTLAICQMSEPFTVQQLFFQGIVPVLLALLLGGYLLWRSKKNRSYLQWSIGTSLLIASVCAGLALLLLFVEVQSTESFGFLMVLIAPSLPLAVIALVTILSFSVCVLWGAAHDRFVTRMGFLKAPGKRMVAMSVATLTIAGTLGAYLILPTIHLLPYRELVSDDRAGLKTLTAIRFNGEFVPIISLKTDQWPRQNPTFRLRLDWRGRAVVDVWRAATAAETEATGTYYLPFKESTYRLKDGAPVAIQ